MVQGFQEELSGIDRNIEKDYKQLIVAAYKPIFERLARTAISHMEQENIPEIKLDDYTDLVFRQNGNFFQKGNEELGFSILIAEIYQKRVDRIAALADNRGHSGITLKQAMRDAAEDFKNKISKSIENHL